jgi:hypothetical protein
LNIVYLLYLGRQYHYLRFVSFRHARKHFSGLDDDQKLLEVQNVMGLLAYPGSSPRSPYKVWTIIISQTNKQICVFPFHGFKNLGRQVGKILFPVGIFFGTIIGL